MIKIIILTLLLLSCSAKSNELEKESIELIKKHKINLNNPKDLNSLSSSARNAKLVLLGESTHGTAEYYYWRAEISKQLIENEGFSFIAVEGDWASLYKLNQYVKWQSDEFSNAKNAMKTFSRWPEWLWANEETAQLIEWLKNYNKNLPSSKRVGFYGMDVYGQWDAIEQVVHYFGKYFPNYKDRIEEKLGCYLAYSQDDWHYPQALRAGAPSCSLNLVKSLDLIYNLKNEIDSENYHKFFHAKQSAYVAKNAEIYFRVSPVNSIAGWNSRVEHMMETIIRLFEFYGENSKGIVWAHNTHVGDAEATDMAQNGVFNIGHFGRKRLGRQNVFIVGFGTYEGQVNAGSRWGEVMKVMQLPPAFEGSIEKLFRQVSDKDFYLVFNNQFNNNIHLNNHIPHRAIGVTYNPNNEQGNYVPSVLSQRYDAFIFIPTTKALKLLE